MVGFSCHCSHSILLFLELKLPAVEKLGRIKIRVLYLYTCISLLTVHTNQRRSQCEGPRENSFERTKRWGASIKDVPYKKDIFATTHVLFRRPPPKTDIP